MDGFGTTVSVVSILGVAAQRLSEILDPIVDRFLPNPADKPAVMAGIAFVFGIACSYVFGVVLVRDFVGGKSSTFWDHIISALAITAGSESTNSLLKLVSYAKERTKPDSSGEVIQDAVLHGSQVGKEEK